MEDITKKCDNLLSKIILLVEDNSVGGKRHYRFADVVMHKGYYWKESTQFILNNDNYKDSILRNYIERCPEKNLNKFNNNYLELLTDIINNKLTTSEFLNFELPTSEELVIHLRLGDVIEDPRFLSKNYLQIIKDYTSKNKISKIIFCTAFHYGNNITQKLWMYSDKKHKQNITKLRSLFMKLLQNINIPIHIKSSAHVDADFIYMAMSKHFISDFGGFSELISNLRKHIMK